jgi:stage II sporulation protein D
MGITTKAMMPFFIVLFLSVFQTLPAVAAVRQEMIRVAILKGVDPVLVDGTGILVMDGRRQQIRVTPPLTVKSDRKRLSINGRVVDSLIISAPAVAIVNGKSYRGTVEILPAERGLLVVNELPLEEYLVGLINCEISSVWPLEAIKAQAVVARSFALYQKEARKGAFYHLEATVLDQVYDGCAVEDARAALGVRETAGEVLTFNGSVILAFFHSNCGGHTEAVEQVWSARQPYLSGVPCRYCLDVPTATWEVSLSLVKIESLLRAGGVPVTGLRDIKTGLRNGSGRLSTVRLTTDKGIQDLPATSFRKALGYTVIRSTGFEVAVSGDSARFTGSGYGHGVGMCQWGARSRAADGFSYREILAYYYPGTVIKKATNGL